MDAIPTNAQTPRPLAILIVDDELSIRKTLGICLETDGHKVAAVSNVDDALVEANEHRFDLVFLDIRLGTESGLDALPRLLEVSPWLKVVMITAYASIETTVKAMRHGAFDYLPKPFTSSQVLAMTRRAQEFCDLEDRVKLLEDELSHDKVDVELKSQSTKMLRAIDLARNVAASDATVLITGESGTGKGVLVKAIHAWSARAGKPFSVVSCPSLSAELLESELFGHTKGAFTGATRTNPGRIAACEGGTVFLDEIGDLPIALQPKLLRFIQDHEYESLGDPTTRRANVRIIAATNVDLTKAIQAGTFREDLFYRLNVIQIDIPPLRERAEDIPMLANRFVSVLGSGKRIVGLTDEAQAALRRHSWPGNVRELRNVIERAVILSAGQIIEAKDLAMNENSRKPRERLGDLISLEKIEESHIRRVLAVSPSMEEAARVLGIDSATLWRKRKKYGL